jgi:hypothetical protein
VTQKNKFYKIETKRTQALQISPVLSSSRPKHFSKSGSYRLLSVKRELKQNQIVINRLPVALPSGGSMGSGYVLQLLFGEKMQNCQLLKLEK